MSGGGASQDGTSWCTDCGEPVDPVLAARGWRAHIMCMNPHVRAVRAVLPAFRKRNGYQPGMVWDPYSAQYAAPLSAQLGDGTG